MKPYGSLESLYQGNRRYRSVLDEKEVNYLNVELTFYNRQFDREDWDTTVTLRAVSLLQGTEVCKLDKPVKVSKDLQVVIVRDGWGTPDPGFWKKGSYKWEAYIDGKLIGEVNFYITNVGLVSKNDNPFFNIQAIKLFESPYEGTSKEKRKYFNSFNATQTRYINVELTLENLLTHLSGVPLEFQVAVYNDTHQLKAFMTMFRHVGSHEETIILETGYGTREPGFWYKDYYTLELRFMDQIVAVVGFEVGEEDVEASEGLEWDSDNWQATPEKELTFDEAKAELDELIGLKVVKDQINDLATYLRYIKLVGEKKGKQQTGIARQINLHSIFMGNPGTGKTTVANMLGKIYKALGVLNSGKVYEVGRAELVAEYIGQTAPKVKKAIEQARGGILFIDEAYSLSNRGDDEKDFGREVIEVLLKEMSDGKGDIAIICAGYTKEMESFMKANPGLTSRFGQVIEFPDYIPDELMQIADYTSAKKEVMLDGEARQAIYFEVVEAWRNRNRNFGNARFVNGVIEEAKKNMALRLMAAPNPDEFTADELITIAQADVEKIFKKGRGKPVALPIDSDLLQKSLAELNALVGLSNIKTEVNEQVKLVRYYIEIGRDVRTSFSLHTVFSGNPGTGKTTVARILAQIYKALGILERGHLVETDRKGLVAGFVGQTAIKTTETVDSAIGGCLFIDEAYSLTQGGGNDYGREAIETLLKRMEDDRGKFMVIVAGYTKEMQQFLESNPGLKSRFDKHFYFKDYTDAELMQIAEELFALEAVKMDTAAKAVLQRHLNALKSNKSKFFGNGRAVRKIVAETIRQQHLRLAGMPAEQRNADIIATITTADIEHLRNISSEAEENRGMGFQIKG